MALISHASKVMLKIPKPGVNSMWTMNLQMFKLDLEKAEEPEIKIANIRWIIEKAREFQKNIYFYLNWNSITSTSFVHSDSS